MELDSLLLCAIYIFSKSATAFEYSYVGCFVDNPERRLYQTGHSLTSTKMTVLLCRNFCMGKGNTHFAIQVGAECRCGEADPAQEIAENWDERRCDYTCISQFKERCGGYRASSVYTVCPLHTYMITEMKCDGACHCKNPPCSLGGGRCPAKHPECVDGWMGPSCNSPDTRPQYVGCYADLNKVKNDMSTTGMEYTNVKGCVNACQLRSKTYTGVGKRKCSCGEDFGLYNDAPPDSCVSSAEWCDADLNLKCGNEVALAIYRTCPFRHYLQSCLGSCNCEEQQCTISDGLCVGSVCKQGYSGERCDIEDQCFAINCKNGGLCLKISDGSFKCICRLGFQGTNCEETVDDAVPFGQVGLPIEVDIFKEKEITKTTTTIRPNVPTFVGCYSDTIYKGREQLDLEMKDEDQPTNEQCVYYCLKKLRTYAGMKRSNLCRCVDSFAFGMPSSAKKCNIKCAGDIKHYCGGKSFYSVYTVCTPHFYLFDNKECESRCNCLEGQCNISSGECPNSMCMSGWTGPTCNDEILGSLEGTEKCRVLKRNGLFITISLAAYAVGATGQMIGQAVCRRRRMLQLQRRVRDLETDLLTPKAKKTRGQKRKTKLRKLIRNRVR